MAGPGSPEVATVRCCNAGSLKAVGTPLRLSSKSSSVTKLGKCVTPQILPKPLKDAGRQRDGAYQASLPARLSAYEIYNSAESRRPFR